MTDIYEILIKSDKPISEFDDDLLFTYKVLSISQYTMDGELYFNLLFDQKNRSILKKIVSSLFDSPLDFQIKKVENKNWVLENQKSLKPLIISGLYIHNDSYQKDKYKKINICINEGQAFGTGHHGTTSGCVNALLDLQKNIKVKSFLDIGTGSGLLSIVANKIWKCKGISIDNDKKSIDVSRNNFNKNNCKNEVSLRVLDITKEPYKLKTSAQFDLIMINILANVVDQIKHDVVRLVAKNGILVLSGFTVYHKSKIRIKYQNLGFMLVKEYVREGWITLVLKASCIQLQRR
ncbi:MAG: hypothetical protein CML86_02650 [Rhodobiaceae bacterium]|nr:hypothetical protein [Rhodobiaceae bacterium]MDC3084460.1 50S ribosomal protein L11 methyltransferase [Gammaproteobacteria bacterium]|tara:strand:- start:2249 stop:3124 length:876 start_codon:yes stop_codon:yes gene_type:complete